MFSDEPEILSCSLQSRQWRGAGLKIEILEPFRRLRITYNGFLRKHGEAEDSVEHIQFNFMLSSRVLLIFVVNLDSF